MRRALVGVVALGAIAGSAPAASGAPGDTIGGGCGYGPLIYLAGSSSPLESVIYDESYTRNAGGTPIAATAHCWIDVNGSHRGDSDLYASGLGAQEGNKPYVVNATQYDVVQVCEAVQFGTDTYWTDEGCRGVTTLQAPPQAIIDLINSIMDTINNLPTQVVDPILCPILSSLAGTYGPITIDPTGDVYYGGKVIYDCPPY
jgi:hypothetical protein